MSKSEIKYGLFGSWPYGEKPHFHPYNLFSRKEDVTRYPDEAEHGETFVAMVPLEQTNFGQPSSHWSKHM